ncbi:GNAT family N-acetyltransferase [Pediococcus ethanolidurans]|uniref:GNAT family N-acetyltransferase n=1 Tax=Pediococcus ethanolidurans TaxID=319653 RepID=UPI00295558A7|nr:GNAT family N-acetyltransferase [Pediococcus ethanolidurans]
MKPRRTLVFKLGLILSNKLPSQTQLVNLYSAVGWIAYTQNKKNLVKAFNNSVFITAWSNEQLVGLARGITDQQSILFIQDVLVLPDFQRQKIGSRLISNLVQTYPVGQTVLITDDEEETQSFYTAIGLRDAGANHIRTFFKDTRWN